MRGLKWLDPETKWGLIGVTVGVILGFNGAMILVGLGHYPGLCP